MRKNESFSFEIVKRVGVLKESATGWKKELTIVDWNGNGPKYDIREWDENYEKMTRGITLTLEEARKLKELLNSDEEL